MRFLFILLILLSSCKTSKRVQVSELEKIKSEINIKIDSLSTRFTEILESNKLAYNIDSTTTDFEISFKENEVGQIDLSTPQGSFSATKSGNGNVIVKGKSNTLKSSEIESSEQSNFEKTSQTTEKTETKESERQSETKATQINITPPKIPWYFKVLNFFPWWCYLLFLLIGLILIFWKALKTYLKTLPVIGRFIK